MMIKLKHSLFTPVGKFFYPQHATLHCLRVLDIIPAQCPQRASQRWQRHVKTPRKEETLGGTSLRGGGYPLGPVRAGSSPLIPGEGGICGDYWKICHAHWRPPPRLLNTVYWDTHTQVFCVNWGFWAPCLGGVFIDAEFSKTLHSSCRRKSLSGFTLKLFCCSCF